MMDASERALLRDTVRAALADTIDADDALDRLGWHDMLASEIDATIEVVFGALGEANAAATALDDVVLSALGVARAADTAAVFPPFGTWQPPGRLRDGRVRARGLATIRAASATEMLVPCNGGFVRIPTSATHVVPAHGIDPDGGWHRVEIDADAPPLTSFNGAQWHRAVAYAQRAVAHELSGASRAMLDLARAHALERVQFGKPIARFQAVRHRLAEALVAIEALDAALSAAADTPGTETAQLAKAVAGRTAQIVGAHCQQVLAGIGFTTDHAFHRYLKRSIVLDGLFGSADALVRALGRTLLDERRVPTLIQL